jgi:NAD(P)-dependent dehydrogenase (short-subunit alcohol dehydrogenase family)
MDLQLTGKRAQVSGSSRGIGPRIARALLAEGTHVAIAAPDAARLAADAAQRWNVTRWRRPNAVEPRTPRSGRR